MDVGVQVAIITAISALVIALIKRRPSRVELNGLRAKTDLAQQQTLDSASGTIKSLTEQLSAAHADNATLRAERDDTRARLARCRCGEGEG